MTSLDSRFAGGPWEGKTLGEAWRAMPPAWTGTRVAHDGAFPILVKFIFPEDKLSVQVHPHDEYARLHEQAAGGLGKTEMWYVVAAREGSEVCVGLKPGVGPADFRHAIADGSAENCIERFPVRAGEAIFVPPGTVHTIGPGSILCEIQEYSDLTYRVYDYHRVGADGRPREMHLEKAMDVINFGVQGGGKISPAKSRRGAVEETHFAVCRYFATEKWEFCERVAATSSPEHFDMLIFLEGSGRMAWPGGASEYSPAQVWFIPAALGDYEILPAARTSLLRTFVPPDLKALTRELAARGIAEASLSRLVHS